MKQGINMATNQMDVRVGGDKVEELISDFCCMGIKATCDGPCKNQGKIRTK